MKKSPLYTRTGDAGQTSLVGGQRVSKCCDRLEAYGTVDELNSHIGLLRSLITDADDRTLLLAVQNVLFVVGSHLATDTSTTELREASVVSDEMVQALEQAIDRIDSHLPQLRAFVLPGGTRAAAQAHVARTVCRRAERCILRVAADCPIDPRVTAYVNRLSDLLFALARKQNVDAREEETVWMPQGVKGGE
jgi:cob(I)alamin adenosyltransferase